MYGTEISFIPISCLTITFAAQFYKGLVKHFLEHFLAIKLTLILFAKPPKHYITIYYGGNPFSKASL